MLNKIQKLQLIKLEPHPIKLETFEELIEKGRLVLARVLILKYCELNERQKFTHTFDEAFTFADFSENNIKRTVAFNTDLVNTVWYPTKPVDNIFHNRSLFIHTCIHCGTRQEQKGVGIYDIVCDSCSHLTVDKVFLEKEDYKHETLILIDEE